MSDEPLTNAAVEWMRRLHGRADRIEVPPTGAPVADDFLYVDHRTGGANYGSLDASGWRKLITETWRVGSGRPTFSIVEVLAVRGQWSAAVVELTDFGDETSMEYITCFQLDPDSQLERRHVNFDIDDRGAALAELDRLHAEVTDEPDSAP